MRKGKKRILGVANIGANVKLLSEMGAPKKKPEIAHPDEIASLPRHAQVAFAARCAVRVFPLVGSEGHFNFWEPNAKAQLRLIWAGVLAAVVDDEIADSLQTAIARMTASSRGGVSLSVGVVSYAAQSVRPIVGAAAYSAGSASESFKVLSSGIAIEAIRSMRGDFEFLRHNPDAIWEVFQKPLYLQEFIEYEEVITSRISKAFESVGAGDLLKMWSGFFYGEVSLERCRDWLQNWLETDGAQLSESASEGTAPEVPPVAKQEPSETETVASDRGESKDSGALKQKNSGKRKASPLHTVGAATTSAERPARVDRLNREGLVKNLANMLSLEAQGTPITIGLFGHWGAGKSSIMQLLQQELSSRETRSEARNYDFLFGWFNAWEYEHTRNIRAGLAQEVVNGLLSDGSYRSDSPNLTQALGWRAKLNLQVRYLWQKKRKDTCWLGAKLLGTLAMVYLGASGMEDSKVLGGGLVGLGAYFAYLVFKQGQLLWQHPLATELATFFKLPSYRKELGQIPVIRKQLEELCEVRLHDGKTRKKRLILFVDDLDRCLAKTIAGTFDAIRLIAHIPEVIVIVGIDERIAFKAMGQAYADYADHEHGRTQEDVARDYLGKIIQLPIRLSRASPEGLQTFIGEKLFPENDRLGKLSTKIGDVDPEKAGMSGIGLDAGEFQEELNKLRRARSKGESIELSEDQTAQAEQLADEKAKREAETQRQAEQDEWNRRQQEKMRDTDEEVSAFVALNKLFDFSNPRQLMRLRNTYRLLKALYPNKAKATDADNAPVDTELYPEGPYNLLMMLFWLEFKLQSTKQEVERWKQNLEMPEAANAVVEVFHSEFLPQAEEDFKDVNWQRLRRFAETCLLPYPTKEILKLKEPKQELEAEKRASSES